MAAAWDIFIRDLIIAGLILADALVIQDLAGQLRLRIQHRRRMAAQRWSQ